MQPVKAAEERRIVQEPVGPVEPGIVGNDQNRRAEYQIDPAICPNCGIDRDYSGLGSQNDQRPDQRKNQNRAQAREDLAADLALRRPIGPDLPRPERCGKHQIHHEVNTAGSHGVAQKVRGKNTGEYPGEMAEKALRGHDGLLFSGVPDHMNQGGIPARTVFGMRRQNSGIGATFSESARLSRLTAASAWASLDPWTTWRLDLISF